MGDKMKGSYNSVISLDDLLLQVNLGAGEDERSKPQDVKISFKLFFKKPPVGCETDNVEDTECYFKLSCAVEEYCENKEFHLLEYLCMELYKQIRNLVDNEIKIWVKVDKCRPPIKNIVGVTSFEYSDL